MLSDPSSVSMSPPSVATLSTSVLMSDEPLDADVVQTGEAQDALEVAVVGRVVDDRLPHAAEGELDVDVERSQQCVDEPTFGGDAVDERVDEVLDERAGADALERGLGPSGCVLVTGVVAGQQDKHQIVQGLLSVVQARHAVLGDLGHDLIDLAQKVIGLVDVLGLDLVEQVVDDRDDLLVGHGGRAHDAGDAAGREVDGVVAVIYVHAADGAQVHVDAAGQAARDRIEGNLVDIQVGQVSLQPCAQAGAADLLEDGPQHAAGQIVEHLLAVELLTRVLGGFAAAMCAGRCRRSPGGWAAACRRPDC